MHRGAYSIQYKALSRAEATVRLQLYTVMKLGKTSFYTEIFYGVTAFVGFILALMVLCRLKGYCTKQPIKPPRKGTLASLLNFMMVWLFVANLIFTFAFLVLFFAEIIGGLHDGTSTMEVDDITSYEQENRSLRVARFYLQLTTRLPAFSHICLAYVFYSYIVKLRTASVLEKQARGCLLTTFVLACAFVAAIESICFFAPPGTLAHESQMIVQIVITALTFSFVSYLYCATIIVWHKGRQKGHGVGGIGAPRNTQRRPLWKLVIVLIIFIFKWLWVMLNDCIRMTVQARGEFADVYDVPATMMTVADALVLGNLVTCQPSWRWWGDGGRSAKQKQSASSKRGREAGQHRNRSSAGGGSSSMRGIPSFNNHRSCCFLRPQSTLDRSVRIFASTFNSGPARSLQALGPIHEWIPPPFHDAKSNNNHFNVYVIGLQECAILEEVKHAIYNYLGGPEHFVMYHDHVWSVNGHIAILLFARTRDVNGGVFELRKHMLNKLNLGVSVGVGKLPNKAAVGLAFRIHDRIVACVTAHFAADKNGRERVEARVRDAMRSLKGLRLSHEAEEVEIQYAHHHLIFLGDLNYRVKLAPERVLEYLASSCIMERRALMQVVAAEGHQDDHHHHQQQQQQQQQVQNPPLHHQEEEEKAAMDAQHESTDSLGMNSFSSCNTTASHTTSTNEGRDRSASQQGSVGLDHQSLMTPWRLARYRSVIANLPIPGSFGSFFSASSPGEGIDIGKSALESVDIDQTNMSPSISSLEEGGGCGCGAGNGNPTVSSSHQKVLFVNQAVPPEVVIVKATTIVKPGRKKALLAVEEAAETEKLATDDEEEEGDEDDEDEYDGTMMAGGEMEESGEGGSILDLWWWWVHENDELSRIRSTGKVFYGFVEGRLAFPPSFRWIPGARIDYGKEGMEGFQNCYTLRKASEREKGLRPPSYTDRILCHSLPDLRHDLTVEDYDVCENVMSSDHRATAAALRLIVTGDGRPSFSTSPSPSLSSSSNSSSILRHPRNPAALPLMTNKVMVTLTEIEFLPTPARNGLLKWSEWVSRQVKGHFGGGEPGISGLIVHYPTSLEDCSALAYHRQSSLFEEGLSHRGLSIGGSHHRAPSRLPSNRYFDTVHELSFESQSHERMKNDTRPVAADAAGGRGGGKCPSKEVCFKVQVGPGDLPMYAVVRVMEKGGRKEVGQGMLCLREVLTQHLTQEERRVGKMTEVEIANGGCFKGILQIRVKVSVWAGQTTEMLKEQEEEGQNEEG